MENSNRTYTKHIIYSCYANLFERHGVALNINITTDYHWVSGVFIEDASINKLNLHAALHGLASVRNSEQVLLRGNNKYVDGVIERLPRWKKNDEIDLKEHSHILREIDSMISRCDYVDSEFHLSRRADSIFYSASQMAAGIYAMNQRKAIEVGRFENYLMFEKKFSNLMEMELWVSSLEKPLTPNRIEKEIELKRKRIEKLKIINPDDNIIPFSKKDII